MPLGLRRTARRPQIKTWTTLSAVAAFSLVTVVQPSANAAVTGSTTKATSQATQGVSRKATSGAAQPRVSVSGPRTTSGSRSAVDVYRVERTSSRSARKTKLSLKFPDGRHRAKTSLVHPRTGVVYVVTSDKKGAGVYRTGKGATSGRRTLKKVADAPANIAKSAFSNNGRLAALATAKRAYIYHSFQTTPSVLDLPDGSRGKEIGFNNAGTRLVVGSGNGQTSVAISSAKPLGSSVTAWVPSFSEDFDAIDPTRWNVRNQTANANEDSYLMASNTTTSDGALRIRAAQESMGGRSYTSGYLDSNGKVAVPNYFRAEIRAKVPMQQGMWGAPLWFRPTDSSGGEMDLVETYGCDRSNPLVHQTIHTDYGSAHRQAHRATPFAELGDTSGTGWHTYTMEKTPGSIVMWTDGVKTATYSASNISWFNQYYEAGKSWNMRINLQVGGADDNRPDASTDWSGENTTMQVDYVHTWVPVF